MLSASQKKRLFLIIVLASIISLYLLFFSKKTLTVKPQDEGLALIDQKPESGIDTDGDGLKDWEETLWGSSYTNPDTDKDGTPDGEEVRKGRDPLVPGPNDQFADKEKVAEIMKQSQDFANLNTTERLGQDLFAKLLLVKQSGGQIDEETSGILVDEAIKTLSVSQKSTAYSILSFISNPDNSPERTKEYANTLISHLRNNSVQSSESVFMLLNRYVSSEGVDTAPLEKIKALATAHREIAEKYHKMAAPSDFIEEHRTLTNTMTAIAADLDALSDANTDPVMAVAALGQFGTDSDRLIETIKKIGRKLNEKGIVFNSQEPGIAFIRAL